MAKKKYQTKVKKTKVNPMPGNKGKEILCQEHQSFGPVTSFEICPAVRRS